jgi:general secretion pathway protein G
VRQVLSSCFAILAIIGLLVALVWPWLNRGDKAHIIGPVPDIKSAIVTALGQFEIDNGQYPKGLHDLVQKPDDATNWHGPYFDPPKVPVDPWGNEYIYEFPGKHNPGSYDLMSAGPDGKKGTEDDICNWQNN